MWQQLGTWFAFVERHHPRRCGRYSINCRRTAMLQWALTFLVLALIAAVLGFGGIAASFAMIGKVLFFVFLILFVVSLLAGGIRQPRV
jgi:uncharacterized membrane protein YtjA (UPF0391 family)